MPLGSFWRALGNILRLGALSGPLGLVLRGHGASWGDLEWSWASLWRSSGLLGHLGASGVVLGGSSGHLGQQER